MEKEGNISDFLSANNITYFVQFAIFIEIDEMVLLVAHIFIVLYYCFSNIKSSADKQSLSNFCHTVHH